ETGFPRQALALVLPAPAGNGHELHRPAPRLGANLLRELVAVELGHADVEERHIRMKYSGDDQSLSSIRRHFHFVALKAQHHRKAFGGVAVVVRYQHSSASEVARLRRIRGRALRGTRQRQPHDELAPFSEPGALRLYRSTM